MSSPWGPGSINHVRSLQGDSLLPTFKSSFPTFKTENGTVLAVVTNSPFKVGECFNNSVCYASSPNICTPSVDIRKMAMNTFAKALDEGNDKAIQWFDHVNSLIQPSGYGNGNADDPVIRHVACFEDYMFYMRREHQQSSGPSGLYADHLNAWALSHALRKGIAICGIQNVVNDSGVDLSREQVVVQFVVGKEFDASSARVYVFHHGGHYRPMMEVPAHLERPFTQVRSSIVQLPHQPRACAAKPSAGLKHQNTGKSANALKGLKGVPTVPSGVPGASYVDAGPCILSASHKPSAQRKPTAHVAQAPSPSARIAVHVFSNVKEPVLAANAASSIDCLLPAAASVPGAFDLAVPASSSMEEPAKATHDALSIECLPCASGIPAPITSDLNHNVEVDIQTFMSSLYAEINRSEVLPAPLPHFDPIVPVLDVVLARVKAMVALDPNGRIPWALIVPAITSNPVGEDYHQALTILQSATGKKRSKCRKWIGTWVAPKAMHQWMRL
eukprot:1162154-Pelagomonas_calceolata.AAC.2